MCLPLDTLCHAERAGQVRDDVQSGGQPNGRHGHACRRPGEDNCRCYDAGRHGATVVNVN